MKFYYLFHKSPIKERDIYKISDENNMVILQDINNELRNKFKIELQSRNAIILSLIQFLSQGEIYNKQTTTEFTKQGFVIIKTDIKNFFPSINKHLLYKKISKPSMLNEYSVDVIKSFIFTKKISGIPLGLPFSSSLSEIYLEEFDQEIRQNFKPIFYFRYVDDILIINNYFDSNTQNVKPLNSKKLLVDILSHYKLKINDSKTQILIYDYDQNRANFREIICNNYTDNFIFLGYKFSINNSNLIIDISDSKFNQKLLNKVIRSFIKFYKSNNDNHDFWLLYYRLINLIYGVTSNGKKGLLKFGLGHSYKYINSTNNLKRLLKTYLYYVNKLFRDNKINSAQRRKLNGIISVKTDEGKYQILNNSSKDKNILLLLCKRINYNNFSISKLEDISKKINAETLTVTSGKLYKYNLQVRIMKTLRLK